MGTLLGRAVHVVACRVQSAVSACGCAGKMSNGTEAVKAVNDRMSTPVDCNSGLNNVIVVPDIHIEHVASQSCDMNGTESGSTSFLNGNGNSLNFSNQDSDTICSIEAVNYRSNKRSNRVRIDRDTIDLPERFRSNITKGSDILPNGRSCDNECNKTNRQSDISRAISWIHQELESLREHDKVLLRQFLDLRAAIRSLSVGGEVAKLRTLSYGGTDDKLETIRQQSSGSDATDDVTLDDDDDVFTLDNASGMNGSFHEQFRGRTVSCTSPRVKHQVPSRHLTKS